MRSRNNWILRHIPKGYGASVREIAEAAGKPSEIAMVREILEELVNMNLVHQSKELLLEREIKEKGLAPTRHDGLAHYRWRYSVK